MESIRTALENLTAKAGMQDWPLFWRGLVFGVVLWILVYVALGLVKLVFFQRKKTRSVTINGESGDLVITINAVEEFVRRILTDFHEASLGSLDIRENKGTLVFNVNVQVIPDAELIPLREAVQQRIAEDARQRLGIENPLRINLTIQSMEADGRKIEKADRKLARRTGKQVPEPPAAIEPEEATVAEDESQDIPALTI
jgi:hypothetical protein